MVVDRCVLHDMPACVVVILLHGLLVSGVCCSSVWACWQAAAIACASRPGSSRGMRREQLGADLVCSGGRGQLQRVGSACVAHP